MNMRRFRNIKIILLFVILAQGAKFASGQSNVIKFGWGAVRLKNVYIPRRYRSSPFDVSHLKFPA